MNTKSCDNSKRRWRFRRACVTRLFAVLLLAIPVVVRAQLAFITNGNAIIITGYLGPRGPVTIPATTNGYPVTGIQAYALSVTTNITSLTLGPNVMSVGEGAFEECFDLTSISIPANVTNIADYAFSDCTNLTSINVPNSVTSIGNYAFNECTALKIATLGATVTNIGQYAFYECYNLSGITIPDGVTSIPDYTFYLCTNLGSVTMGPNVTNIGNYAFSECAFAGITIPGTVTSIGNGAFYGCSSVASLIVPNAVTSIGDQALANCTSLSSITVNDYNSAYGSVDGVLFNQNQTTLIQYPPAKSGKSYTVPDGVAGIADGAFLGAGLTSVTISGSVTNIGNEGFQQCDSLRSVYLWGNAPAAGFGEFYLDSDVIAWHLPGTAGWTAMFAGIPTASWYLSNPLILNHGPAFGIQANQFGFTISWSTNGSVVVEACTNLVHPVWTPVSTNTLAGGSAYFADPQWAKYPTRFYRLNAE